MHDRENRPRTSTIRRGGILLAALMLALPVAVAAGESGPGAGKTVQPTRANWDSFWFGAHVLQIGLEKLGYDVKKQKTLTTPPRYAALASGDVDYSSDVVWPNGKSFIDKVKADIELLGPIMKPGSIQGYLVDRKTAEAHKITSVEDLKRPEIIKLLDADGDGKADLTGCNPGWACEKIINHHMKAYNLEPTVKHLQGEYNVLVGDAVARYKAGKPVLLYAWYPNVATIQMLPGMSKDLVWLNVPKTDLPKGMEKVKTEIAGIDGCAGNADPCNTGWSATTYFIGVNKAWMAKNPAARKFFEVVKMKLGDRVKQNLAMKNGEDSEADIRRHAEEWIAANKQKFEGWLAEARAAAK